MTNIQLSYLKHIMGHKWKINPCSQFLIGLNVNEIPNKTFTVYWILSGPSLQCGGWRSDARTTRLDLKKKRQNTINQRRERVLN